MKRSCVLLIIATLLLLIVSAVIAATPTDYNTLFQNKQLNAGQRLTSSDDRYQFEVQSDGNCVLYDRQKNSVLWASGTSSGQRLTLQPDGNLVMLDPSGSSTWQSGTAGTSATRLTLNDDGALVLYDGNTSVWRIYSIATNIPGALTADKNRGEWTLMVIPDTQGYAENWLPEYPYERMRQTFKWIADISDQLNIKVVQHVGDMVETNNTKEWNRVVECFTYLKDKGIPAIPCGGNHESYDNPPYSMMNQNFKLSEYQQYPWWGGHKNGIENTYQLFNFGKERYLFLTLEFQPGLGPIVDWARDVVDAHPDRKVIFTSHWNNDQTHYKQIIGVKPNVIMSLAGHKCIYEHYVGPNGSHSFVQNYQNNEGKMNIRYYKFKPLEDKVEWFTYSPVFGIFENDSISQGSFKLPQKAPSKQDSKKDTLIDFRNTHSINSQKPIIIAHRGGVITPETPECSIAAIRLAKQQGYTMVELDVQKSRDGIPIVFHDNNLKEACGINNRIANMDSKQIANIKFSKTGQTIVTLERALEECIRLSLGVMLDVKVSNDETFYQTIANLIKKYKYEPSTITISTDPILRKCFKGVIMLTVTPDEFNRAEKGETIDLSGKYWFGLPHRIPDETVKRLRQNGAYVIPAINTFRYPKQNHYELAQKDINRLIRAGVEGFQIDSVYMPLLSKEKVATDSSFSLKLLWTKTYNDHGEGAMTSNIESCEFSPDGKYIAAGCGDGRVLIITVPEGEIYRELNIATGNASDKSKDREVECIAWTRDGKYLAAAGNKHIPAVIIDVAENQIIETLFDNGGDKDGMGMSHDGKYLAIADIDHVRIYDTENWSQITRLNPLNDRSNNSIEFACDDSFMAVAGNKGRVAIVTAPDWKVERVLYTDQLNNDYPKDAWGKPSWWVKSTRISPDKQYVAYGISSGSAFAWKRDGTFIKELPMHTYVEAVSFSPNGKVMVAGGNDQDTWTEYEQPQRFYSVPDFDLIMEFSTPGENCEYIDWSPDSKYMVQPSTSGNIMLFEANWNPK